MQQGSTMKATGGRAASRERRAQLVQGKGGMPPAAERSRVGTHESAVILADNHTSESAALETPAQASPAHACDRPPMAWSPQRITGTRFSSDEAASGGGCGAANRITGDTPRNVSRVTGTQRGAERNITGTSYYCANAGGEMAAKTIERAASGFSVRSPQLDAQLHADAAAARQPSAEGRITGTFARGEGKITGNQEFHFSPRQKSDGGGARTQLTGEGRMEGSKITGGAWDLQSNVTGTEDYIAAERNPSERSGHSHSFANASLFKGKGKNVAATQHVTGMVGWSAKTAAKVTLSGGSQG